MSGFPPARRRPKGGEHNSGAQDKLEVPWFQSKFRDALQVMVPRFQRSPVMEVGKPHLRRKNSF